jgi:hypothetical protein
MYRNKSLNIRWLIKPVLSVQCITWNRVQLHQFESKIASSAGRWKTYGDGVVKFRFAYIDLTTWKHDLFPLISGFVTYISTVFSWCDCTYNIGSTNWAITIVSGNYVCTVLWWKPPRENYLAASWPFENLLLGIWHGRRQGVGVRERSYFWENPWKLTVKICHRKISVKLTVKIRDFWENAPPFKILATLCEY